MDHAVVIDHPGRAHSEGAGLRPERRERPYRAGDGVDDPVERRRRRGPALLDDRAVRIDQRDPQVAPPEVDPEGRGDAHALRRRRVADAPRDRRRRGAPSRRRAARRPPRSTWSRTSGTAPSSSLITLSNTDGGGSGRSSVPADSKSTASGCGVGSLPLMLPRSRRGAPRSSGPASLLAGIPGSRSLRSCFPAFGAARRAAQAPRRCSPGYPARGRSAHASPLSTTRLRSRNAVPTIMPDAFRLIRPGNGIARSTRKV